MIKTFTILIAFILAVNFSLCGQKVFKKLEEKEKVVFSYQWKPSKFFKKNSPLMLIIKIENMNAQAANIHFSVDYFYDGIRKATSEKQEFCIKGGKTLKGKLKGLGFDSATFNNEQLLSNRFDMELNDIQVDKVNVCKR